MNPLILAHDTQCSLAVLRRIHDSIFYSEEMSPASRSKAMQILFHAALHLECRPSRQFGSSVPLSGVRRYLKLSEHCNKAERRRA